jgi:hypothetical protein
LKAGIKCFIALFVALIASFCVSASDTTTRFQTGPFNVSVDFGQHCNDINISKPYQEEKQDGTSYINYIAIACGAMVSFITTDKADYDLNRSLGTNSISEDLVLLFGADEDTISLNNRNINGMPGVVGSGYVPDSGVRLYLASFYVTKDTIGHISVWGNESKMDTILKTIHVTKAA